MVDVARINTDRTDDIKVPPHSLQAEQSVLGGLMLDNQTWDTIADRVGDEDFYRQAPCNNNQIGCLKPRCFFVQIIKPGTHTRDRISLLI